jgi:hypothetical protein
MVRRHHRLVAVTSSLVKALFSPPTSSVRRSNCSLFRYFEPLNIMCSKRCAKPDLPSGSSAPPTWYPDLDAHRRAAVALDREDGEAVAELALAVGDARHLQRAGRAVADAVSPASPPPRARARPARRGRRGAARRRSAKVARRRALMPAFRARGDDRVVLDRRRRGEERSDDRPPLREERPAAEADGVVLERLPPDHQHVALGDSMPLTTRCIR